MAKKKIPSKYREKKILEAQYKKKNKPPSSRKKINWKQFFKALPKRISKFFRDVIHELKRVSWPSRKELLTYAVVVLVTIAFFAILLGVFDLIFLRFVEIMTRL